MKLRLDKKEYCIESKKALLPLKHDRYLSRAHSLISFAVGLVLSLLLFGIAGLLEGFFSINRNTIFISSLIFSIICAVSFTIYIRWKSIRIETIEMLIDLCEHTPQ